LRKCGDETGEEYPEIIKLNNTIRKIKNKQRKLDQANILLETKMGQNTENAGTLNSTVKGMGETIKTKETKQKSNDKVSRRME
jgi:hypothetical protein